METVLCPKFCSAVPKRTELHVQGLQQNHTHKREEIDSNHVQTFFCPVKNVKKFAPALQALTECNSLKPQLPSVMKQQWGNFNWRTEHLFPIPSNVEELQNKYGSSPLTALSRSKNSLKAGSRRKQMSLHINFLSWKKARQQINPPPSQYFSTDSSLLANCCENSL